MQPENFMIDGEEVVYFRERIIGAGAFGEVFKSKTCSWIEGDQTSKELAVKWLGKSINQDEAIEQFDSLLENKLKKVLTLEHDCVIRYWAAYLRHPKNLNEGFTTVVIMDHANGGSLKDYLKGKRLPKAKVGMFTRQLLRGLDFLHSNGIIHTDLKPANVVLHNSEFGGQELKIADWDDPTLLNGSLTKTGPVTELAGTAPYLSPEMASEYIYDEKKADRTKVGRKTDIWSLGCVVWDMIRGDKNQVFKNVLTGKIMSFNDAKSEAREMIRFIHGGGIPVVDDDVDVEVREFISKCHQRSAELRPTAADLLDSPSTPFILNSTFCKVKEHGDYLLVDNNVSHLFKDEYDSSMFREIVALIPEKPLHVISHGKSNWKTLLEGIYEQVAILQFQDSHNWSSECLSGIHLPNLVNITFWRCEDIALHKGHWEACPNLRVISFQYSSIQKMEENFLNELPSLRHFGILNKPLSVSQIEQIVRIGSSTDYTWLDQYLQANPALLEDKRAGELYRIHRWKSNAMRNAWDCVATKMLRDCRNRFLLARNWLWAIELPQATCSSGKAVDELSGPLTNHSTLSNHHLLAILVDLGFGLSDEMIMVLSSLQDHIVTLHIQSSSDSSLKYFFDNLHLPNLLELEVDLCENVVLRKGCFDRFPKLRALWMKRGQFPVIEENIFFQLPQFQSIAFTQVELPSADQLDKMLWLKKFVQKNPQLLKEKLEGELWKFRANGYYYASEARKSDEGTVSSFAIHD